MNLALFKYFQLHERLKLRAQASYTNAFNHPNFGAPNVNISQPTAVGTITSTEGTSDYNLSGGRIGLLGLRLEF